jgi:hypothetical protein
VVEPLGSLDFRRVFNRSRGFGSVLNLRSRTRRTIRTSILATLAFAVLVWGVQYKLSVYQAQVTPRRVVAARFSSPEERPAACAAKKRAVGFDRAVRIAGHHHGFPCISGVLPDACLPPLRRLCEGVTPQWRVAGEQLLYLNLPDPRGPPNAVDRQPGNFGNS